MNGYIFLIALFLVFEPTISSDKNGAKEPDYLEFFNHMFNPLSEKPERFGRNLFNNKQSKFFVFVINPTSSHEDFLDKDKLLRKKSKVVDSNVDSGDYGGAYKEHKHLDTKEVVAIDSNTLNKLNVTLNKIKNPQPANKIKKTLKLSVYRNACESACAAKFTSWCLNNACTNRDRIQNQKKCERACRVFL